MNLYNQSTELQLNATVITSLYLNILTWNSTANFFSIQSVTWVRLTSLSPTQGLADNHRRGLRLNPYLQKHSYDQLSTLQKQLQNKLTQRH